MVLGIAIDFSVEDYSALYVIARTGYDDGMGSAARLARIEYREAGQTVRRLKPGPQIRPQIRPELWIALAAFAAFSGSLFSAFHFDDYGMLQDVAVTAPLGWFRCFSLWQTRPLTWLSFWLNYQLTGREPLLWHAVNLVLHAACAVILYRILRMAVPRAALLGTLIFALHPIQSEPVDYVYSRAILLCTLFSLLALRAWIQNRSWIAVSWFTLAVLSKEECIALPILFAVDAWLRGRVRRRALPLGAMLAIAAVFGIRVIAAIQVTGMQNIGSHAGISPLGYLAEQGIAILRYLGMVLVPYGFSIDPQLPLSPLYLKLAAWALIVLLAATATLRIQRWNAAFWMLGGLILLLPSSSIFPAADLAADRRMYLPMLAFAPAIALLIRNRWKVAIALILLLLSVHRTYIWHSDQRLWSEAARLAPDKSRPKLQLARALPPEQAIEYLRGVPETFEIATETARIQLELNHPADALAAAGRALALAPHDPHAINNRGAVLLALKQTAAARRDFVAALAINPCLPEARANLSRTAANPGEPQPPACRASADTGLRQ